MLIPEVYLNTYESLPIFFSMWLMEAVSGCGGVEIGRRRGCSPVTYTAVTSCDELGWLLFIYSNDYEHTYSHTTRINTQTCPHPPSGFWGSMISSCEKSPTSPVWGGHLFPELFKALLYRASWYWWIMPPCNYVTFNNRWVGGGGWGYGGGGGCWCPFTNLARTAGMVIRSRWC